MIDLAKPLGIHEGLIFYGDHEQEDLVYYFPDEVGLAPQISNGSPTDFYELFFQIFHEGDIVEGGIDALRETAGSILSLGVKCGVTPSRLDKAVEHLKSIESLPDELRVSTPMWKDGKVDLMVLDSITTDDESLGEDAFVKSIIGAHKPSLMSSDLKSIFNVRLDRRGTALISSALEGGTGTVAGVLYDLKYTAIRPAVDLRIWADLGRCYDSVSHELGVKAEFTYGVKFSLGAEFEWLTKKLEENGDLKIELLTQVTNPETKKQIDEMVKEFKEKILRELFRPYVNPQTESITMMESAIPVVGVSYKFKKEKIKHNKIIEVDYRERSTTIRTHNPQSHLWVLGKQIEENKDKYIQKVVFSDVWREQELDIKLIHDFENEEEDLLSVEVIVWRKKDGVEEEVLENRFSMPEGVDPLHHVTFHEGGQKDAKIAWIYDKDEEVGYYYQIRFLYSDDLQNISSPREIVTKPVYSSSQDLIIFPDTYTFHKKLEIREGNISFEDFKSVDVTLSLRDNDGELLDTEIVTLKQDNPSEFWTVRGKDKDALFIEASREYHYDDERPSIKTESLYLTNDEVIVNKPFVKSDFKLIPVIAGDGAHIKEILLEIIIKSPSLEEEIKELHRIPGPDFNANEITIKLHSAEDKLFYRTKVITNDAQIVELAEGEIVDNALVIDLKASQENEITFKWEGTSPALADLKYLRIELRKIVGNDKEDMDDIEFKGDEIPEDEVLVVEEGAVIEFRIVRRFFNGTKEKDDWEKIEESIIKIKPYKRFSGDKNHAFTTHT